MLLKSLIKLTSKWKLMNREFEHDDFHDLHKDGCFKAKVFKKQIYYKITSRGISRISEGVLVKENHNFLVYLSGLGVRKFTDGICEDGTVTNLSLAKDELKRKHLPGDLKETQTNYFKNK